LTVNPVPTVTVTNPAAVCLPATVDLTAAGVTSGSTAGLTFTYWLDAATTLSYATPAAAVAGTYYIKGTDVTTCYDTKPVTVTVNAVPTVTVTNPAAVCSPTTVDLTAPGVTAGSTAGLTFTYWTDAAATLSYATPASAVAGTYYIKGTDVTTCYDIKPVTVTINMAPTVTSSQTDLLCSGITTGEIDITAADGTAPYNYAWTGTGVIPTAEDQTGLTGGSYSVIVTDVNGCTSTSLPITLSEPLALNGSASVTTAIECNGNSATVTLAGSGGTGLLSYMFNGVTNTTGIFSGIPAGVAYAWSVTDANSCGPLSGTIDVTEPAAINIAGLVTNASALGGTDGAIDITVSGGIPSYSFLWTTVDGSGLNPAAEDQAVLTAGTYNVVVTDGNSCISNRNFTVFEPVTLLIDAIVTDVKCNAGANGSIQITISGGISPYTYSWTTADGGGLVSGEEDQTTLTAGTYNLNVTDAGAGTASGVYIISEPSAIVVTINSVSDYNGSGVKCYGANDGLVNITTAGGMGALSASWSGPSGFSSISEDITGLLAGSYTVIVTDTAGCSVTETVQLSEPEDLILEAIPTDAKCPDSQDGAITLTITGGSSPYVTNWDGVILTQNRTDLIPETYSVIVTDINGCAKSLDVVVGFTGSEACLVVSEIITPYQDGHNDTWKIKNIEMYPNAEVLVYTRWGKLVFSTKNIPANPWDGTFKGKLLPTDSYHYILHLNDGSEPRSGIISIIR
jgi:gliding motility-associated-like protein